MTKFNWIYVAKGHYSARDGDWTVHVLDNGAVYKTHPSRATADVTGAKADRYVESAQTKFPVRGKRRAKPDPDPNEKKETPMREPKASTPKKKAKKKIGEAAKKLAKGAATIIGTTRAFVTEVGEAEERQYAKRKAPPIKKTVELKKKAPTKKKIPTSGGRPTIVRRKKPSARRTVPAPVTDHPLQYLISGGEALPPTRRKATGRRREQTLEEYLGF